MSDTMQKFNDLVRLIASFKGVAVAFSGGVDSSLLLYAAKEALRDKVIAFIGVSPMLSRWELEEARKVADAIGIELVEVDCDVLGLEAISANPPDRCYHCKRMILTTIGKLAAQRGLEQVLDGTNADDTHTGRPGLRATIESGTRSPLAEIGITKTEVRELAQLFGLPSADRPSSACLASRIPFGGRLTPRKLQQVEQAEDALRALGIGQLRVRHHDDIARLEVSLLDIGKVLLHREEIVHDLKAIGFTYVTLDLEGFRSGSMEEALPDRRG